MDSHSLLTPVEHWSVGSDDIRTDVPLMMGQRATLEMELASTGTSMAEAHGEAVAAIDTNRDLIIGASRFAALLGRPLAGTAIDLGSGTGVGAAILSRLPRISEVYAVDYSEDFVNSVMPVVFAELGAAEEKIRRVVGDYSDLHLPDGSVDVVLEIGAFHHSENLPRTLNESRRVLASGGVIIAVDRAWPDSVTDRELDEMTARQLPDELKQKYGIPVDSDFTRGDWGEHEYRYSEWLEAFRQAGFKAAVFRQTYSRLKGTRRLLKAMPTTDLMFAANAVLGFRGGRTRVVYGTHFMHHVAIVGFPQDG